MILAKVFLVVGLSGKKKSEQITPTRNKHLKPY